MLAKLDFSSVRLTVIVSTAEPFLIEADNDCQLDLSSVKLTKIVQLDLFSMRLTEIVSWVFPQ